MNKKGNNSRQAKCKPANVFLEGQWSVALYKLYSEVFAKNCQHSWDAFVVPINMHVTWLQRYGVEFKVH